ncbi:CYFA0S04e05116g1_1 [Cyberlindnera fabianii]|uniref:CYFA0S04e05116g1_1 n=1 Tax=Cyberlindnera fabianii TaxID=36022 RepID=A0A061ARA3_CYBFA|nr:CYFA0S04e05116g1_1 [Cyberlindnera fabianii]
MGVFRVNRASFIGVKNRLFGADVKQTAQLAAIEKLIDSLTYTTVTVFRVLDHYSSHVSSKSLQELPPLWNHEDITSLQQKLAALKQRVLRTSETFISRKNKLTHNVSLGEFSTGSLRCATHGIVLELVNLTQYIRDLVRLSRSVEPDHLLDLFKGDVLILQFKILPAVESLSVYLEQFQRLPGRPLDLKLIESMTLGMFEQSSRLRGILRSNSLLIRELQEGIITRDAFLIKRNNNAVCFINLDPVIETLKTTPHSYVGDVDFLRTIINDTQKATAALGMHALHILNNVQSSMDLFFQLSNILDGELSRLSVELNALEVASSPSFAGLADILTQLETTMSGCVSLTKSTMRLKEFRIDELILGETVNSIVVMKKCLGLLSRLCSLRSDEQHNAQQQSAQVSYQTRYTIMLGCTSLCTMGLENSICKYADLP